MGFMRERAPTRPRPPSAVPPRAIARTVPNTVIKAVTATSVPPAPKKEEEKLCRTAACSPVKTNNITTNIITNNASKMKVVVASSEVKEKKGNEKNGENDIEKTLISGLHDMTLTEDNDLNQQLKNLKIKDNQQDKEPNEDSELLSRGPDRVCTKGISRTAPYPYEQHIVSSDKQGGGTVFYPNISQLNKFISCPQVTHQNFYLANCQYNNTDSGPFTNGNYSNGNYTNTNSTNGNYPSDLDSELEKMICSSANELPRLTDEDLKILGFESDLPISDNHSNISFSCDLNKTDTKDVQYITQDICKGGTDRQLPPTPDSDYYSDENSIGSPSSTTSTSSFVTTNDKEKTELLSAPYGHVVAQQTTFLPQSGLLESVIKPAMFIVEQQGLQTVMPPPPPPPPTQQMAPPSTPPLSPRFLRPILPGISIPPPCNECTEPAVNRIRSVMLEENKAKAWGMIFALPDEEFTTVDKDGNTFLSRVLSNRHKIKSFIEVLHALIQRLKSIIATDKQMVHKLLSTPNSKGHTLLDVACFSVQSNPQDALAVRYLADTMVEEGFAIGEEVDNNGNTLLHKICAYGDKACFIVAEFLNMKNRDGMSVFDVNKQNNEGKTPLHITALKHSDKIPCTILAQLLMRSGAAASKQEGCAGNTVFHCVARESCDPNLLVTLLAKTSDVGNVINKTNYNGDTPLHMVAANHAIPLTRQRLAVQHLIDYEADPKLQNKSGKVPLSLVPADRKQDIKTVLYHK